MPINSRRNLPPFPPERIISPLWLPGVPAVLAVVSCLCRFYWPSASFAVIAILFGGIVIAGLLNTRIKDLASQRPSDSIGTFARAFDCRRTDTLVIRAVYGEIQHQFSFEASNFPVRPSDNLFRDLLIDPDDLDFDYLPSIARRTGRRLAETKSNPYFNRVQTVEDLVYFVCALPRDLPKD